MSVPYMLFNCDSCGIQGESWRVNGYFHYVDPNGNRAWMKRKFGYCSGCESFAVLEELPDPADLPKLWADWKKWEYSAARDVGPNSGPDPGRPARPWWANVLRRLWHRSSVSVSRPGREPAPMAMASRKPDNPRVIEAVLAQCRCPVCLSCGSTLIHVLNVPDGMTAANTCQKETGVLHPRCGGMFWVHGSGSTRIANGSARHLFDLEGLPLHDGSA